MIEVAAEGYSARKAIRGAAHRGIIDALYQAAELMRPEPEIEMIARPTDITQTDASSPDLPPAETPLQRQILLWQRELLRRAEAGKERSGEVGKQGSGEAVPAARARD